MKHLTSLFTQFFSYLYQKKVFGLLIVGFVFTAVVSWVYLNSAIQKNINFRLDHELNHVVNSLNSNIANHANTLGYVQAYFKTEGLPTPKKFRRLAESIEIQQVNHGLQGVGYISIVKKEELKKFIADHKSLPFFNLDWLKPGREIYAPITMVEPMTRLRSSRLGYDMMLEDSRREAILQTIQSTGPILSKPLNRIQVQDPSPQTSLILLAPFFNSLQTPLTPEDRLKNIRGVIYVPLRMKNFFEATLGLPSSVNERVNFKITHLDAKSKNETVLYERFDATPDHEALTKSRIIEVYGHLWRVEITTFPNFFYFGDRYLANTVAFCFLLLIGLLWSLFKQTQNLLSHEKKAKELMESAILQSREQTKKLKLLNEINGQANLELDIAHSADNVFNASLPLSQSSNAFLFLAQTLENPEKISFYRSYGFEAEQLQTMDISLQEVNQMFEGGLILKNENSSHALYSRFVHSTDSFFDWILIPLPSLEFKRSGFLFLGRKHHKTYTDTDIELIESLATQFGNRLDNLRLFKKVEDSNKVKTAFLSNMSHEIRTPLNAITGFSEILESAKTPSEKHNLIEGIKKNTSLLTSIIDNILDISKIEFGRLFIQKKLISTSELVRGLQADLEPRAKSKGLQFAIESKGSLPSTIEADESRVKQILINLVGNAIKFTQKGSVKLQVYCETTNANEPWLIFNIVDTGIGISQASQAELFQSFTQVEASHTRRFGGIGLGLALSRRLAQQFGGEVTLLHSQLQMGSTFQLKVPCGPLKGTTWIRHIFAELETPQKVKKVNPLVDLKDKRVLIVEDSEDNQEIFQFFLNSVGAVTDVIDNGEDAVKKVLLNSYDLILMDIQLPRMDGLEATRRIRLGGFTNPIIALTAHASSEEKMNCLRAGCIDLITKPVTQLTLIKKIQTIIEENTHVER